MCQVAVYYATGKCKFWIFTVSLCFNVVRSDFCRPSVFFFSKTRTYHYKHCLTFKHLYVLKSISPPRHIRIVLLLGHYTISIPK